MHTTSLSPTPAPRTIRGARSLSAQPERDRLEQRALRVRQVLGALRERAETPGRSAPRPLLAAIEDFGRELSDIDRQLRRSGARR